MTILCEISDKEQNRKKEGRKRRKKRNLYEPISSAVNAAANAKPRSSAARVFANGARSTFERTVSLRPSSGEESLTSAGIVSGKMGQSARDAAKAAAAAASESATVLVLLVVDEADEAGLVPPLFGADAAGDEVPTGDVIADAAGPLAPLILVGSPETMMGAAVLPLASGKLS
jgi:hypothetical protein